MCVSVCLSGASVCLVSAYVLYACFVYVMCPSVYRSVYHVICVVMAWCMSRLWRELSKKPVS